MVSCGISTSFPVLFPTERKVAHALLTRPPLEHFKASSSMSPLDLHVLSTPPAFVLSQDQTLAFNPVYLTGLLPARIKLIRNYCHNFAFLVLYRFQGSAPRCALAPCDLYILTDFLSKVNTFFQLFQRFLQTFCISERIFEVVRRLFRLKSEHSDIFAQQSSATQSPFTTEKGTDSLCHPFPGYGFCHCFPISRSCSAVRSPSRLVCSSMVVVPFLSLAM